MNACQNILVVKYGALGDVVRTSFFAKPIKLKATGEPQAVRLYWLTAASSMPLLRFNPYIDVIVCDPTELQDVEFDTVYSLDDEVQILAEVARLKTKRIIGASLSIDGNRSYCERSAYWFDMGLLSRFGKEHADQLKRANHRTHSEIFKDIFETAEVDFTCYSSNQLAQTLGGALLKSDGSHVPIGLNAFAGKRWPSKSLPEAQFSKLVNSVAQLKIGGRSTHVYLIGSGADYAKNTEYATNLAEQRNITVLHTDNNILELMSAVGNLKLLVTADSLCLHLAVGQKVPTVSFFAPTSAAEIEDLPSMRKLKSTSADYCSYRPDADNSTITADRIMELVHDLLRSGIVDA